jgi:hypothetical protein
MTLIAPTLQAFFTDYPEAVVITMREAGVLARGVFSLTESA